MISRSLSNRLRGISFYNYVELKMWLDEFFESSRDDFYGQGIHKLVKLWQEVVNNAGEYMIDWFAKIVHE